MKVKAIILFLAAIVMLTSCRSHGKSTIRPAANQEYTLAAIKKSVPVRKKQKNKKTPANIGSDAGQKIAVEAYKWIGVPYKYAGETKSGVDCSGMVMKIYEDVASIKLPRSSSAQHDYCTIISRKELQPGDLVFFSSSASGKKISHVGIYIGNNTIIHASSSRGVIKSGLDEKYYSTHYHSSGRALPLSYNGQSKQSTPNNSSQTTIDVPKSESQPQVEEMSLDDFIKSQSKSAELKDSVETSSVSEMFTE